VYLTDGQGTSPKFPHYPETLPLSLLGGDVWVVCDGDKVPLIPGTRGQRRASSSRPETWRSYEAAFSDYHSIDGVAGVGRMFAPGEGLVGIDLDDVIDAETGEITPRAVRLLETLDSYSEVSPSSRGVKVWVRAELRRGYVRPRPPTIEVTRMADSLSSPGRSSLCTEVAGWRRETPLSRRSSEASSRLAGPASGTAPTGGQRPVMAAPR